VEFDSLKQCKNQVDLFQHLLLFLRGHWYPLDLNHDQHGDFEFELAVVLTTPLNVPLHQFHKSELNENQYVVAHPLHLHRVSVIDPHLHVNAIAKYLPHQFLIELLDVANPLLIGFVPLT
jgi:hypothetical protein